MNIDIKNLEDQDMRQLVKSLELVSARIFDSVVRISQLAASNTPEMQQLFSQWVACLSDTIISSVEKEGALYPDELARNIGVTPATIISLTLTLHREGRIKITEIKAEPASGDNTEICGCMK
ncbi:hypothetical protein [Cloacibacillus porcorum]|uniref:hypothetical protein n=1 Tax=Cloacibacillus porcorum TaxID=1197717 RepID=UPI002A913734|nr:hypothetical protein [Cloacibacillus porcorum]MDY5389510.1 hypothetical protein [Cloacibacillus porcorum]